MRLKELDMKSMTTNVSVEHTDDNAIIDNKIMHCIIIM